MKAVLTAVGLLACFAGAVFSGDCDAQDLPPLAWTPDARPARIPLNTGGGTWEPTLSAPGPRKPRLNMEHGSTRSIGTSTQVALVAPESRTDLAAPGREAVQAQRASTVTQTFCQNIADPAADARFLAQKNEIAQLEARLAQRIALLEEKRAAYETWLQRRDDFVRKAEGGLAGLYTKVKPDAAAAQLAAMDEETAAAIVTKLSVRNASAILDQMDAAKAARLTSILAGAAQKPEPSRLVIPSPPQAGIAPVQSSDSPVPIEKGPQP